MQKRLFSVSATRSAYDDVRVLDFGKIMEQATFGPRMATRVTDELSRLAKWEETALKDLAIDPNKGADEDKQRDLLLKVNGRIYEFKETQNDFELQLDVLKDAIALLSKHGEKMEKATQQMVEVDDSWAAVKKQAPIAKELGRNVQEREAKKIQTNIQSFENDIKSYEFEFKQKQMFTFDTGVEQGYVDCIKAHKELLEHDKKWDDLSGFAKIFEFPELMEPSKVITTALHQQTSQMLQMWHFVDMITSQVDMWKTTLWNDLNCEEIEDGAKGNLMCAIFGVAWLARIWRSAKAASCPRSN